MRFPGKNFLPVTAHPCSQCGLSTQSPRRTLRCRPRRPCPGLCPWMRCWPWGGRWKAALAALRVTVASFPSHLQCQDPVEVVAHPCRSHKHHRISSMAPARWVPAACRRRRRRRCQQVRGSGWSKSHPKGPWPGPPPRRPPPPPPPPPSPGSPRTPPWPSSKGCHVSADCFQKLAVVFVSVVVV
jgi:hypothetical protein